MTQSNSSFSVWLHNFRPAALNTRPGEWLRATLGATAGVLLTTWICQHLFGLEVALHLLGPLCASAYLLFAISSGALAQPWSIVGGYLTATLIALLLLHWLDRSLLTVCLAMGSGLLLMCLLRCLHPPAAAMAVCVVLVSPNVDAMGWALLLPVMLNALCLAIFALLYNNFSGVRYPKYHVPPLAVHHTKDVPPEQRLGIQAVDLQQALNEFGEYVDITHEDLERIIHGTEKHALRRSMGALTAAQIMSCDLHCVGLETPAAQALNLLSEHHLKSLPVIDEQQRLLGMVGWLELFDQPQRGFKLLGPLRRGLRCGQVMRPALIWVDADAHVVELLPLMESYGVQCLPVVQAGKLLGIISQTDLIAALHRDLLLHLS